MLQWLWRAIFSLLIVALAYAGGYFVGRHPQLVQGWGEVRHLVILTTDGQMIPSSLRAWIEERSGKSVSVFVVPETQLSENLSESDLLILPRRALGTIKSQLNPLRVDLKDVSPDLIKADGATVPALWKLTWQGANGWHLQMWEMAWSPRSKPEIGFVDLLLSFEAQKIWSHETGYSSVRQDSWSGKDLRQIPLHEIHFD